MVHRPVLVLVIAFVLSVLVRVPLLDRPLSAHHEFCTALVLTILHNWQGDGYATLDGGPAITFTGHADRYPAGWSDLPGQRDGVLFYFSHPPLAYDLPHVLFSAVGAAPNVLGLQLFNLFFHLVTTLALYLAVRDMHAGPQRERAGLYAGLLYLFMPAPLWFHSNAYMSDMFVQNFWVLHLAMAVRLFADPSQPRIGPLIGSGLTLFLAVYTSWLGVFGGVAMAIVAAWYWRREPASKWWLGVLVAGAAVLAALMLTFWRYAQVVDASTLINYYAARFAVQSTPVPGGGMLDDLREVVINYRISYLPVIALLVLLFVHRYGQRQGLQAIPRSLVVFLLLTALPVVLDHTIFLHYARHDFTALKAGPLLCGLAGLGLAHLPLRMARVALVITAALGVMYFFRLNPIPGYDGGRYAQERDLGLAIANASKPDQAVLFLGHTPEPQVGWYARRTIIRIDSLPQAFDLLRRQGTSEGVVFRPDGDVPLFEVVTTR